MRSQLALAVMMVIAWQTCGMAKDARPKTDYGRLHDEWKAEVTQLKVATPPLSPVQIRDKKQEINQRYTQRFFELARQHPDDDLWLDCLIWTTVEGRPGAAYDAMFDLLKENAAGVRNDIQLKLLMSEFIPLESDRINPALAAISETHPERLVRGTALYALGARTKRLAERAGDVDGCQQAAVLLQRVMDDFPNASTYRGENHENAAALLKELRSPVAITKTAPEINGDTLSGEKFQLAEHRGKIVVISFSGHWCAPCVAMHDVQKRLRAKYTTDQLVIVELNSDKPTALDDVRKRVAADGLNWIIVPDGPEGPLSEAWHVTNWPTYYILDQEHHIRRRATGNLGDQLIEWVDELLE